MAADLQLNPLTAKLINKLNNGGDVLTIPKELYDNAAVLPEYEVFKELFENIVHISKNQEDGQTQIQMIARSLDEDTLAVLEPYQGYKVGEIKFYYVYFILDETMAASIIKSLPESSKENAFDNIYLDFKDLSVAYCHHYNFQKHLAELQNGAHVKMVQGDPGPSLSLPKVQQKDPEVEQPQVTETQPEVQTSEPEIPDPEPVDHFERVAAVFTDIVAKVKSDFGIEFTPEIFAFVVHGQGELNSNQAIRVLDSLNVNQLYQLSLILGYEDRSVTAFEEWLMTFCTELGKLVGEKRGSRRGHRSSLSRDINEVIIKLERLEDMMTRMDDHRGTLEVRGLNRASYRGEPERSMGSRSPRNRGLLETERD